MKIAALMRLMIIACLVLPIYITFGTIFPSSLPLSIVLLPFSFWSFISSRTTEAYLLFVSFVCSFLAIWIVSLSAPEPAYRPIISAIFFYLPLTSYYLAKKTILSAADQSQFLIYSSRLGCLFSFAFLLSIVVFFDWNVRTDTALEGNFFGLPLAGSYGIHSLVSNLFLMIFLMLLRMSSIYTSKIERFVTLCAVVILVCISVASLSREIVVALYIGMLVWVTLIYGSLTSLLTVLLTVFAGYLTFDYMLNESIWSSRLLDTFSSSGIDDLSSGRLGLFELSLSQIWARPFTGTGFYGFILDYKSIPGFDDLEGWSTHIYLLTALWKMGAVAFVFFFVWFSVISIKTVRQFYYYNRKTRALLISLAISFCFVINIFWDALLAPNNSMLFLYLMGSFQFLTQSNENYRQDLASRRPNFRSSLIRQSKTVRDPTTLNRAVLRAPLDRV